jgi:glutathione S-transferase
VALNPNAKVPVLDIGTRVIWESNAIMCHLARLAGSGLWPEDDRQVGMVRWLSWNSEHFSRHGGCLYFEYVVRPMFGLGPVDAAAAEEATGFFRKFATVLNDHLEGRRYMLGEALTVADFAVAATLPYAEQARLPIHGLTALRRWHDHLCELPAWREPFPTLKAAA